MLMMIVNLHPTAPSSTHTHTHHLLVIITGYQSVEIRTRAHTNHGVSDGLHGVSLCVLPTHALILGRQSRGVGLGFQIKNTSSQLLIKDDLLIQGLILGCWDI